MTMIAAYDVESDTFTHHAPEPADTWRLAVHTEAALMQANAPAAVRERITAATHLALDNNVELALDGHATVASRSVPGLRHVVNGTCGCKDAAYNAPNGLCAHRIAVGLVKRATKHLASPVMGFFAPRLEKVYSSH